MPEEIRGSSQAQNDGSGERHRWIEFGSQSSPITRIEAFVHGAFVLPDARPSGQLYFTQRP
jgi:hypothetical protein